MNLLFGLVRLILNNPQAAISNLRFASFRRLCVAMGRYDNATVLAYAQNALERENQHVSMRANVIDTVGMRKAYELEARYPGITNPVGLGMVHMLEEKLAPPVHVIDPTAPTRINVLLPQLDPLLMFGGYIACLHFIRKVQDAGFRVRILLCETGEFDRTAVVAKLASNPLLQQAVVAAEIENITRRESSVVISPADAFVCYSFWTGIKAHALASAVGSKFIYFLQEYEAVFHPNDSCYALAGYVYRLPHRAIFNTTLLADYFRSRRIGVFGSCQETELDDHYVTFQHALTPTLPPSLETLRERKTKRLLFYGRPEGHARRNLFEVAVIGLRMAVQRGVFDEDWEFYGVGTLGPEYEVELGPGRILKLVGAMPQSDYGAALREYDVGLSLMLAPHPSILPFEMASAGQIVVTNTFESRTEEVLRAISSNIEPCDADPLSVAQSLEKAVVRVSQYESRVSGSEIDWVRDWDTTFSDDVMRRICRMLCE